MEEPENRIILGNISYKLTEEDLVKELANFIDFKTTNIFIPKKGKKSSGLAIIDFETNEQAKEAKEKLTNQTIDGRICYPSFSKDSEKRKYKKDDRRDYRRDDRREHRHRERSYRYDYSDDDYYYRRPRRRHHGYYDDYSDDDRDYRRHSRREHDYRDSPPHRRRRDSPPRRDYTPPRRDRGSPRSDSGSENEYSRR